MTGDENRDFAAGLVAAGKRDGAEDDAKSRAFDRVTAALGEGGAVEAVAPSHDDDRDREGSPIESTWWRVATRRRLAITSAALAGALSFAAVGGGMYIQKQSDEKEAAKAAAAAQLADTQRELDRLNSELVAQNAQVEAAQAALANAKDEAAKIAAASQLAAAQSAVQNTKRAFATATTPPTGSSASTVGARAPHNPAPCTCNKLDPLCGCLQ